MITRQTTVDGGKKTELVQKGQGAKDEAFKRLLWIERFHPEDFYKNLWLVPVVGCWKDLWTLMYMADTVHIDKFFDVIAEGINDEYNKDLVKKYLPRIRSNSKCNTDWATKTNDLAKMFCNHVGWSYSRYRHFKSTGKAHEFQRIICAGLYKNINWKTIPGKALLNLVSGQFLKKHNLESSYVDWLNTQPVAKFNGYPYELLMKLRPYSNVSLAQKVTIDKQFKGLIETASKDNGGLKGNILCALDTSGSMTREIQGGPVGLTSYDVCVSLGIYFSELNKGAFHNHVAMFDDVSGMLELKGEFSDKYRQIVNSNTAWGSTNFQSLIDLLVRTRTQKPNIPIEDFPDTLLVISDMQFNPSGSRSNLDAARENLRLYFPDEYVKNFKFVWWYCAGRKTSDVPATMDDAGNYLFSGFDGAIVDLLLGTEPKVNPETGEKVQPSMEDMVNMALSQEVLALVQPA